MRTWISDSSSTEDKWQKYMQKAEQSFDCM